MHVGIWRWKKADVKGVREFIEWRVPEETGKYAVVMHKSNSGCGTRARVEAGEIILTRYQAEASLFLSSECGGVAITTLRTVLLQ